MNAQAHLTRRALLTLASAMPLLGIEGTAYAVSSKDVLAGVKEARAALRTLTAKFSQARHASSIADEVRSDGELTLVLPDQLRWEIGPPDDAVYWVTAKSVMYKSRAGKKIGPPPAGAFASLLTDLVVLVGGDLKLLRARYDFAASDEKDGSVSIVATPLEAKIKEQVKRLTIRTNAAQWGIAHLVIDHKKAGSTAIDFAMNEKNPSVDPRKMKPPA